MQWQAQTPEDMQTVAADILATVTPLEQATVLCLSGDLGAGKTTLVQAIARELGVAVVVTSPTFVIMKQYETNAPWELLIHIDAYRLEDPAELSRLDFTELCTLPNTLLCIEWPERVASLVPDQAHHITISLIDDQRILTLAPYAKQN